MERAADRNPRARPVAGLPDIDATQAAKRWLIELIAASPLSASGDVPVADLAREAPGLCAAVIESIGGDAALAELESAQVAGSVPRLSGATEPAAIVAAVDALRRVLLRYVLAMSPDADTAFAADLADRLSYVCSLLLERSLTVAQRAGELSPPILEPQVDAGHPVRFARGGGPRRETTGGAVMAQAAQQPDGEPAVWRGAIARRLERSRADNGALGVLTVEIDDLDRLLASASGMDVASALEAAERALAGTLADGDELCRSRLGHHWVITDEGDPSRLRESGERLAAAVSQVGSVAGSPLTASVGIASFPADGDSVDALVACADELLFAARAAGVRLA